MIVYISDSTSSSQDNILSGPSDILYEEVIYADGERVYANIKSTTRYIHLVTLLVKHYICVRNLHLICRYMKDKQLLQDIREENNMCDAGSQNENSAENSVGDSPRFQNSSKVTFLNMQTFSTMCHTLERNQSRIFSRRRESRSGPANSCVDTEEVNLINNDLKELKKLPQYLNLFRNHLVKLCRSEDCKVVKDELQELSYLTEGLF